LAAPHPSLRRRTCGFDAAAMRFPKARFPFEVPIGGKDVALKALPRSGFTPYSGGKTGEAER
jgi:hypothetical protein